jgi:hypothetical protein
VAAWVVAAWVVAALGCCLRGWPPLPAAFGLIGPALTGCSAASLQASKLSFFCSPCFVRNRVRYHALHAEIIPGLYIEPMARFAGLRV